MKEKKIAKNYIYNLIYQMLTIILPIITTPYLSRVLGAEKIGVYGFTVSIVTYFTLIGALGISKYGQREIAYVQDDRNKQSKIFWELNLIRLITIIIASLIFYLVFCINGEYTLYYKILLLELFAVVFDISWFFQGIEDFKKVVIRNTIIKLLSLICIFVFVKNENDLIKYFVIYVGSNFIGNISFWLKINKYVDKIKIKFIDLKKHIKPMFSLFIPQIATSVYTVLDKTMLGALESDISEVGYYEQSQKIIKIALTLVTTLSIVMMPRISNTFAKGNDKELNSYMKKSFKFDWFLSFPIIFGIIAIAKNLVPWFYGEGYEKIVQLLMFASPIVIFIALSTTIGSQYLVSVKKQNIQTIAVVTGAILNVLLNLILIPNLKSIGAVYSTVISEMTIAIIEIVYLFKFKKINFKSIFEGSLKYLFASLIMGIIVYLLSNYIGVGVVQTLIEIIVGAIIYLLILFIMKDEFILRIKKNRRII